jgi:hypothetical protein
MRPGLKPFAPYNIVLRTLSSGNRFQVSGQEAAERRDMLPPDEEHHMSDRKSAPRPSDIEGLGSLESSTNAGSSGDDPQPIDDPDSDLNALLAQEQTAIMSAEGAIDPGIRHEQREVARQVRTLVDLTPYPSREPHDFERLLPVGARRSDRPDHFSAELEALKQHVENMDKDLARRFSEGQIGPNHNTFGHRSRLVRQARARLNDHQKSRLANGLA